MKLYMVSLLHRATIKSALNAVRVPKFERDIVVAEKDHGKRFTATFRASVIWRMRRELRGL